MTDREQYAPGPAYGAQVKKDGVDKDKWTLILVRELRHSPEKVWQALTDPAQLHEWAPFVVDGSLGTVGATVNLTWVGTQFVTSGQQDALAEWGYVVLSIELCIVLSLHPHCHFDRSRIGREATILRSGETCCSARAEESRFLHFAA